jgi:hypothetical protein
MLRLGLLPNTTRLQQLNRQIDHASLPILTALALTAALNKTQLLLRTDGGGDLLGADIPKALMVLNGENPYSVQPYAAPYPPFHLLLIAGIIRATTTLNPTPTITTISTSIRTIAVFADLAIALLIYFTLRHRGTTGLSLILPPGLFLLLPSISANPYFFFHTDTFGHAILAGSLLTLATRHYTLGTTLLATATIFKLHPILAIPLVLTWLTRTQGLRKTLPSLLSTTTILTLGLLLPLTLPGYAQTILGFNLSTGFGNGTSSFTIMNLFYAILPHATSLTLPLQTINQIWIIATTTLFTTLLLTVRAKARTIHPVDIVLLGLLAWLLPLRQLYTQYIVWAAIPLLMRGRVKEAILLAALLELANTMAVWSWGVSPNPFPAMTTIYGFFLTSIAYLAWNTTALSLTLKQQVS